MKLSNVSIKAFPDAVTHLEVVPLELADEADTYKKAVHDIEQVVHVVFACYNHVKDENEIIRPGVEGTLSMLQAAASHDTFSREGSIHIFC